MPEIDVAQWLVDHGAPVFAAPPGQGPKGFQLPLAWNTYTPEARRLTVWRPGYALAMVCGHLYDVIDHDPRNQPGPLPFPMPNVYGIATTPGGGTHFYIAPTGLPKGIIAPGWDLQAGTDTGGRGFVFIPGTPGYTWLQEPTPPDPDDPTTGPLAAWMTNQRPTTAPAERPWAEPATPIGRGGRDAAATSYAASLARRGATPHEAETLMRAYWARFDQPPDDPYSLDQALAKLRTAYAKFTPIERTPDITYTGPTQAADSPDAARARLGALRRDQLDTIQPPTPLLAGILDVDTVAILSGKFGTYKTFVAVAWAASIATGRPWGHYTPPQPRRVVYVAAEGASGIRGRLDAWEEGNTDKIPGDMLDVIPRAVRFQRTDEVADLIDIAQGAGLIVLDTLHRMTPGAEEQSARDMGLAHGVLDEIRRATGACVLVAHHTGHTGERARGSSAIEDDADMSWVIKLGGDGESRAPRIPRTLEHRKIKDGELQLPRRILLTPAGPSCWAAPGPIETPLTKNAALLQGIWRDMDGLGVDIDPAECGGITKIADALRERGLSGTKENLAAVARDRHAHLHRGFPRPDWAPPPLGNSA